MNLWPTSIHPCRSQERREDDHVRERHEKPVLCLFDFSCFDPVAKYDEGRRDCDEDQEHSVDHAEVAKLDMQRALTGCRKRRLSNHDQQPTDEHCRVYMNDWWAIDSTREQRSEVRRPESRQRN
jgi:hypothetical protein